MDANGLGTHSTFHNPIRCRILQSVFMHYYLSQTASNYLKTEVRCILLYDPQTHVLYLIREHILMVHRLENITGVFRKCVLIFHI